MGNLIDAQTLKQLEKKNLRCISDEISGISRKRAGKGSFYLDPNGVKISNQNILRRIEELAIPPAWEDIWISPFSHSHLQSTGIDSKGRKQYIYHPLWIELCQENKFEHIISFCNFLPEIRKKVSYDIKIPRLVKEKILATVVWLLENTLIRVGNDEYARDNNSFGLTTLRNRHVKVQKGQAKFEFRGKSGIEHSVNIENPKIVRIIKRCIELPGFELFQYIDPSGERHVIDSGEVNDYLKNITGEEISAKDFRTWGGTVLSAITLNNIGPWRKKDDLAKNISQTVKVVASHLRNTPSVCKNYYIHPTVIETYEKQILIPHFNYYRDNPPRKPKRLSLDEFSVFKLLKKYS